MWFPFIGWIIWVALDCERKQIAPRFLLLYPRFPICFGWIITSHLKTHWLKKREKSHISLLCNADKFIRLLNSHMKYQLLITAVDLLSSKSFKTDDLSKTSIICNYLPYSRTTSWKYLWLLQCQNFVLFWHLQQLTKC